MVVWIWSWGVVRGILKVTVSGVVGNWYFTQGQTEESQRTSMEATQAAFTRASGPSLGSICVSTLALTFTSTSIFILRTIRRLTTPAALQFLAPLHPLELVSSLIAIMDSLGSYTLVHIGLTGDRFWTSGKKSRELVHYKGRDGRGKGSRAGECKSLFSLPSVWSFLTLSCMVACRCSIVLSVASFIIICIIARGCWWLFIRGTHSFRPNECTTYGFTDGMRDLPYCPIWSRSGRGCRRHLVPLLQDRRQRRSGPFTGRR